MEVASRLSVQISERAHKDIDQITDYIAEQGYPETALFYADRIYDFCLSLGSFPLKYKICKRKAYNAYSYRCAFFEDTYVVVYRIEKEKFVTIKRVIHGKRLA